MLPSLTRAQVRDVDRRAIEDYGLPGLVLMENAGRSAAELLEALHVAGPVTIVCGKGNNAGDGFVIARQLEIRGLDVEIFLACPPESLAGDAALFFQVLRKSAFHLRDLSSAAAADWQQALSSNSTGWIVDALLGTGLAGPARGPFATAIEAINQQPKTVFAVDLPSGLDCDTGLPLGPCVRADHTGTFVARKVGFDNPASHGWTGQVHVLDIGIPMALRRDFGSD